MNCPQCNSPIDTQARFCENCGTPLSFATPAPEQPADPAYSVYEKNESIAPPPSPYENATRAGKHESPIADDEPGNVLEAVRAAAAASVAAAAMQTGSSNSIPQQPPAPTGTPAPTSSHDPYAAAMRAAGGTSSAPPRAEPAFAETSEYTQSEYAQPSYSQPAGYTQPATYAQPMNYAQPTYAQPAYQTYAQPASPYESFGADTAPAGGFGLAIASLVVGIIGLLTFGIFGFTGIIGLIFGIIALALRSGYKKRGLYDRHAGSTAGLAIGGIITNVLAMLLFVVLLYIGIMYADETYDSTYDYLDDTTIEQLIGEDA